MELAVTSEQLFFDFHYSAYGKNQDIQIPCKMFGLKFPADVSKKKQRPYEYVRF